MATCLFVFFHAASFFFLDFEVTLMEKKKKNTPGHSKKKHEGLQQSPCETNRAYQGRDKGHCNTGTLLVP